MLRAQRLSTVLDLVSQSGQVTVEELVEKLDVSPATARRDLDHLAADGRITRTRGGATTTTVSYDAPIRQKRSEQAAQKAAIARECAKFLTPGATIGMTGGTTVAAIAEVIVDWANRHTPKSQIASQPILTIVTNAIDVAYHINSRANIKIVVLGGQLNNTSYELTGPFGLSMLEHLWFDIAFIGVNGFDDNGPGTADEYEAHTNRAMIKRASKPIIVADSTKFGRRSFSSVGNTQEVRTIVTDNNIDPAVRKRLEDVGYTVHVAGPKIDKYYPPNTGDI